MSHSTRSAGAHGPWQADDDLVLMDGSYTGPAVGDASPAGTLFVDGGGSDSGDGTGGDGAAAGDVVNVWEVATRMSVGGLMSPAFHKKRQSSNKYRP